MKLSLLSENLGKKAVLYLFLIISAIFFLYPIFWLFISSVKTNSDIMLHPFSLPRSVYFSSFVDAWEDANFSVYFLNTVIVTFTSVLLLTLISSLAAYALARFNFPLKNILVLAILGGLMFPPQAALLPLYRMLVKMRILDTYLALILPYVSFGLPFTIFLLRGYFLSFPSEIEDAAKTDGCSEFAIYWKIVLPNSKPALAAVSIFTIIWLWNEFLFAYCFINNESLKTISVGLMAFQGMYARNYSGMFAAVTIATIPTIFIFVVFERYFVEALSGAVKG